MVDTISSIKNQTFKNYEVWVINGGSCKKTLGFLNQLESPFFYQSGKDKGIYDAMNKGVSLSKGEWLYFLGVEDVFYNKRVLQDVFVNSNLQKSNLISGNVIYKGVLNPLVKAKNKLIKKAFWSYFIWFRNGLHHQSTFYKRELFFDINYCLKYKVLADYWFNIYLFKRKEKCILIDKTIASCTANGISKKGNWTLYKEEVSLKVDLSSSMLKPFFYGMVLLKYLSRKIAND